MENRTIYIFLDIDGVLNNESAFQLNYLMDKKKKAKLTSAVIDEQKLLVLKDLCDKIKESKKSHNEYKIIISSTWRKSEQLLSIIKEKLNEFDMNYIDITPILGTERGIEIAQFCEEHSISKEDVIILDDDSDMCDYSDRLIMTYLRDGLTYLDTERALVLLGLDDVVWEPERFECILGLDDVVWEPEKFEYIRPEKQKNE